MPLSQYKEALDHDNWPENVNVRELSDNKPNVRRNANRIREERNMRSDRNFILRNVHKPYENYEWIHRYDEGHYELFDDK